MTSFLNGITPACAGTTSALCSSLISFRDHPRMCGDHSCNCTSSTVSRGSPPHVRGPLAISCIPPLWEGITPACAGTTISLALWTGFLRDHPRMCGDHQEIGEIKPFFPGSPPHVRGPLILSMAVGNHPGITPLHVRGTTYEGAGHLRGVRDHPRMCGDQ